jgi:hypothetical protein
MAACTSTNTNAATTGLCNPCVTAEVAKHPISPD